MVLIIRITEGDVPDGRMCFLFLVKAKTRRLKSVISVAPTALIKMHI